MYVQRQLGHADIRTTERYYGHLERHVLAASAVATEEAIAQAVRRRWRRRCWPLVRVRGRGKALR
jgi:integrase